MDVESTGGIPFLETANAFRWSDYADLAWLPMMLMGMLVILVSRISGMWIVYSKHCFRILLRTYSTSIYTKQDFFVTEKHSKDS